MNKKNQPNQKNEKKIKKMKILLPLLLLAFGGLCILISQFMPENDTKEDITKQGETKGEPFHKSYSPDDDKEPFIENVSSVTIDEITFLEPVNQNNLLQKNTHSMLMGVNENMKLFRSYGGGAYVYDESENTKKVIGNNISKSTLCTNPNYVATISDYSFHTPKIIPYEIGLGNADALFTAEYDNKITTIACDEQHIYFTVEDPYGNKTSQMVTLQEFQGKIRPSEAAITVENTSDFLAKNASGVYVYLPGKNAFHKFNPYGTHVDDIAVQVKDSVSRFLQMKLNDQGDYLAVYYDENMWLKGSINGEVLDDFSNLAIAEWYDNEHVLFLDTNTLYLYDVISNEKNVLKTNVSDFVVAKGDLYFHNSTGDLYYMQRKTEE